MLKIIVIGLVASLLVLCLAGIGYCQKWGEVTEEEWNYQPPRQYPEANAVILFDRGELEVTIEGISITRHVRIKVFNQAGAEEAGDASFDFHDGDKIKSLKAQTITPDRKKHKIKKKAFHTKSSGSFKSKIFSFPHIENGSILEYKYYQFHNRFTYLDPWYFQTDLYTAKSVFVLKLAPGFTYSEVANNIPASARKGIKDHNRRTDIISYTWTMKDLLPIRDEPYAGAVRNYASALHYQLVTYKDAYQSITFVNDWSDLGEFFSEEVIDDYLRRSDKEVDELVPRVVGEAVEAREKSRLIYEWVRDSIRTRKDEKGRYYSHECIKELLVDRFGTADEKNVLLVEMSRRVGLSAWPVLICTRNHGLFNPEIFQLQQFNHLIACVQTDSKVMFLDVASQYCPYGILPPKCLVAAGFLLEGDKSRVVRLTTEEVKSYRADNIIVHIQPDGTARCSTTTILTGYYTVYYGQKYEANEPEEFMEDYFLDNLTCQYELENHSFEKDAEKNQCRLTFTFTSSDLVQRLDNNLLVKQPLLRFVENPFVNEKRFFPVDFMFPFTQHSIITVRVEDSLSSVQLPADITTRIDGAEFMRQSRSFGADNIVESRIVVSQAFIPKPLYKPLREFFSTVEDASAEQLVLVVH